MIMNQKKILPRKGDAREQGQIQNRHTTEATVVKKVTITNLNIYGRRGRSLVVKQEAEDA